jgi:hypothetical protein
MSRTKNVSAPGGGDDEDPRRPFRQVKGKTIYLEQQEGRKKRRMDRAARAAAAAAAQAELGDQPQTPSDQIAYRVRRLASRPRSSTHTTPSTPPPTLPACNTQNLDNKIEGNNTLCNMGVTRFKAYKGS